MAQNSNGGRNLVCHVADPCSAALRWRDDPDVVVAQLEHGWDRAPKAAARPREAQQDIDPRRDFVERMICEDKVGYAGDEPLPLKIRDCQGESKDNNHGESPHSFSGCALQNEIGMQLVKRLA